MLLKTMGTAACPAALRRPGRARQTGRWSDPTTWGCAMLRAQKQMQGARQKQLVDQEGVPPVPGWLEQGGHVLCLLWPSGNRRPRSPLRSAPWPGWWWHPCRL